MTTFYDNNQLIKDLKLISFCFGGKPIAKGFFTTYVYEDDKICFIKTMESTEVISKETNQLLDLFSISMDSSIGIHILNLAIKAEEKLHPRMTIIYH